MNRRSLATRAVAVSAVSVAALGAAVVVPTSAFAAPAAEVAAEANSTMLSEWVKADYDPATTTLAIVGSGPLEVSALRAELDKHAGTDLTILVRGASPLEPLEVSEEAKQLLAARATGDVTYEDVIAPKAAEEAADPAASEEPKAAAPGEATGESATPAAEDADGKTVLTVTPVENQSFVYGSPIEIKYTVTSSDGKEIEDPSTVLSGQLVSMWPVVGTHAVMVGNLAPKDPERYSVVLKPGTVTVTPKVVKVAAMNHTIFAGTTAHLTWLTDCTGQCPPINGKLAVKQEDYSKPGTYDIVQGDLKFTGPDALNYKLEFAPAKLTVIPMDMSSIAPLAALLGVPEAIKAMEDKESKGDSSSSGSGAGTASGTASKTATTAAAKTTGTLANTGASATPAWLGLGATMGGLMLVGAAAIGRRRV